MDSRTGVALPEGLQPNRRERKRITGLLVHGWVHIRTQIEADTKRESGKAAADRILHRLSERSFSEVLVPEARIAGMRRLRVDQSCEWRTSQAAGARTGKLGAQDVRLYSLADAPPATFCLSRERRSGHGAPRFDERLAARQARTFVAQFLHRNAVLARPQRLGSQIARRSRVESGSSRRSRVTMNSATIGSIVGVAFGCAWGFAGSTGLPRQYRLLGVIVSIAISAILIAGLLIHPSSRQQGRFDGRLYGFAVLFEVVAIAGIVFAFQRLNLQGFLIPAIGFIVGLHFIGLWKASGMPVFFWVAAAMCATCLVAFFLPGLPQPRGFDARVVAAGFGSAVILWVASASTLL